MLLFDRLHFSCQDGPDRAHHQLCSCTHELFGESAGIVIKTDGDLLLHDDPAGIYLVVDKKGGDARFFLAVHEHMLYRGCAAVPGQEGGVQVKSAQGRQGPYGLGQHAESHHDLQVRLPGTECLQEPRVFQFLRLQEWYLFLQGISLHRRRPGLAATAGRLVGSGDDASHGDP